MSYILYFIANTLETLNFLNNQTLGRDKLARLIQYSCRMIRHQLEFRLVNHFMLERLRYIEHATGQFRRLMRMGRCFETAYTAFDGLRNIDDPVLKLTITIRKLSTSLFLYCDHLIWFIRHSFVAGSCDKWYKRANQFWLLSISANLCRNFYDITTIYEKHLLLCRNHVTCRSLSLEDSNLFEKMLGNLRFLMSLHINLILDIIRNSCDVFVPLTSLGFINLNATAIGILGIIASIIGIFQILHPEYILLPA